MYVGCCCVTVGFTNQVIYYLKLIVPAREQEDNSNESVDSGYSVFKVDRKLQCKYDILLKVASHFITNQINSELLRQPMYM